MAPGSVGEDKISAVARIVVVPGSRLTIMLEYNVIICHYYFSQRTPWNIFVPYNELQLTVWK
jgi:hypothetical protein